MEIKTKAKLLTAKAKPYDVDGNVGTSYRVRLLIEDEIYSCKSSEAQVAEMKAFEGQEGDVVLKMVSPKENLSLELVSFE